MVFVTVGTQKQQFTRLLKLVDNSEELKNTQVVVQAGNTHYTSKVYSTHQMEKSLKM